MTTEYSTQTSDSRQSSDASLQGKKLVKKNNQNLPWVLAASAALFLAVFFGIMFWPFAIFFAIVALVLFGYAFLGVKA